MCGSACGPDAVPCSMLGGGCTDGVGDAGGQGGGQVHWNERRRLAEELCRWSHPVVPQEVYI